LQLAGRNESVTAVSEELRDLPVTFHRLLGC
jgi:hypothetical protein